MAVRHGYGKIAGADALVFAYDTGDTRNSYRGEPTTNLYGNWNAYTGGSYEVLDNSTNYIKLLASAGTPWAGQFSAAVSAGTYTVSFQHRTDDGGSNNFNIDNDTQDDNIWNANITTTTEWQTYTSTKTHTGTGNHLLYFRRNSGAGNIYIRNVQLELKSHATPFVKGTRSSTQGLLDLTGNRSINLTNTTFDSNAQMTFDGTNDGISLGTNMLSLQNSSFSLEALIKWDGGSTDTFFGYTYAQVQRQNIHWRIYDTGQLRFDFYSDSINSGAGQIVAGEWVHLIITYDYNTDSCVCYKNGALLMQGSAGPFTGVDASSTAFLGYWGGSQQYFGGDIPIFKAFNRALTAAEVRNNYNNYKGRFNI